MLSTILKDKIHFYLPDINGNPIPFEEWSTHKIEYLNSICVLLELVDNGIATNSSLGICINFIDLFQLSHTDKVLLELPSPNNLYLFIESNGTFGQPSYKFKHTFFDSVPNGNTPSVTIEGPFLHIEGTSYLLTASQYYAIEAITAYNNTTIESFQKSNAFNTLNQLQVLAHKDEHIILETFLNNQRVIVPDKISIDLDYQEGCLTLKPLVPDVESVNFERAFDLSNSIKPIYNVTHSPGKTNRIIIRPAVAPALDQVKKFRHIKDPSTIESIVDHPEYYFEEDVVDLSLFSSRVREIGLYKPKFYPFVSPYKSQWIPGFSISDNQDGTKHLFIRSANELNEFTKLVNEAETTGNSSLVFRGESIPLKEAQNILRIAREQLASPDIPLDDDLIVKHDEVLIIKENAETLDYSEVNASPETFAHSFSSVVNLAQGISLKEHQIEGIAWLQSLLRSGLRGGILADDMGLGKTLQLLYFIEWHAQHDSSDKPYLIVAPVSLLENWENEYAKFFTPQSLPLLRFYDMHGIPREYSKSIHRSLQRKQIILTNYETVRLNQLNICAVDYAVVALDEAQKIKTPGTLITNVCKALKADFKIAMTGTPVENTLLDLWCIMDFSVPGLLGNAKDFSKKYQAPLKQADTNIQVLGESLRSEIGIYLKRRLKQDVAKDLPIKSTQVIPRTMPEEQLSRYLKEVETVNNSSLTGVARGNLILRSLWAIRDISDHPFLPDGTLIDHSTTSLIKSSAKLMSLLEILQSIKKKAEKAIVFADRKETQKMLQRVIAESFDIILPSIINGDTPPSKQKESGIRLSRQQAIDRFQEITGFNVIIMSPLAAGVGLNVTGANHVIHYSRHWNPAKEDQATDRAYRIGQTKDVVVYYPMAVFPEEYTDAQGVRQKSFDEVLDNLLSRKRTLASSTLFPTDQCEVRPEDLVGDLYGINLG